jgi:hypothetical protein
MPLLKSYSHGPGLQEFPRTYVARQQPQVLPQGSPIAEGHYDAFNPQHPTNYVDNREF